MPHATCNGISLWYERAGSGPPLLFISGSGGDLRVKPNVFDGPLAQEFDLLAYDQRGLGRTEIPDEPFSMADYAADAVALLDHIGWQRCLVMGVSFGGMVAQELAVTAPDRIEALVLACTSAGGDGGASYPLHELADLEPEPRAIRQLEISDTRMDAAWRESEPEHFRKILERTLATRAQPVEEAARRGARAQLEARRYHDTWDRLPSLDMPVLICGGRYDGIAPPGNQDALNARIPGSELRMYDGGHMFLVQDKRANPDIAEWLKRHAQV